MGRGLDQLGVGSGFFGDCAHGVDEQVAFFLWFRFGRLDHHRAGDDEWERGGIGMEAVVDQALRDIEDRKSTRLNSSHRCISYAVFCLKKKIIDKRKKSTVSTILLT